MRGTRRDPRAHAILEYVSRESVEHPRQVPPAPASLMACATLLFTITMNGDYPFLRFGSSLRFLLPSHSPFLFIIWV